MATLTSAASAITPLELHRQRRTLVFADLVESVRLMNQHETSVISSWLDFVSYVRSEVLLPRGGELVKSHGDGLLLAFDSVSAGMKAAEELHARLRADFHEGRVPVELTLRIGVHIADVVVQSFDLFGIGVNLVARIATLAMAGQTVVSTEVRDALSEMSDWQLEDLGPCILKHFDEPVRAHRVVVNRNPDLATLAWRDHRPGIAVVPFMPLSSDTRSLAIGDAIADHVIAALSRRSDLRVVSRLSTAPLRKSPGVIERCLMLLKAQFVVTGRCAIQESTVDLSYQLTDARSGLVLWADALRTSVVALTAGQDAAMAEIANRIGQAILRCEIEKARALPIPTLDDYTLYLAAITFMHRMTRADFDQARVLFEALALRHPRNPAPLAQLAKWHVLELAQGWAGDRVRSIAAAQGHARRALDFDPDHALALAMEAAAIGHGGGDLEEAHRLASLATCANAQEPHAWLTLGAVSSWMGEPEAAESMPERALALSPLDPARYLFDVFIAAGKLAAGKAGEAAEAAASSIQRNATHLPSHRLLIVALVLCDRIDEARVSAKRLLSLDPSFRVSLFERRYAGRERPHARQRADALRAAGLPD